MAVDAPSEGAGTVGSTRWAIADRTLTLRGFVTPLRIAAFRGAGMAPSGLPDAVAGVKEQAPGLVFVLGGLGTDEASARAHLDAFAELGVPVVVLPGGDDPAEAFGEALDAAREAHPNLFDGRALRAVVAGTDSFLLLSGAPEGRYAIDAQACGNSDDDREELEGAGSGRHWLVSWAAPSGGGSAAVGRGFESLDVGDPRVLAVMTSTHAKGGIFAWPETRALRPSDETGASVLGPGAASDSLRIVAARIVGVGGEQDDYAIGATGAAVLELTPAGLAFSGTSTGGQQ